MINGHDGPIITMNFSAKGVLATGSGDNTIRTWDIENSKELQVLKGHSGIVLNVNFSNNGCRLASCSEDRSMRIWETGVGSGDKFFYLNRVISLSEQALLALFERCYHE